MTELSQPEELKKIDFLEVDSEAELRALKTVGKLGLTALVPPLGLPLLFKKHKIVAVAAGIGLSIVSNSYIAGDLRKEIYNNPSVGVYPESNDAFFTLFGAMTSPAMFAYSLDPITVLDSGDKNTPVSEVRRYTLEGKDVITFDDKTKQYTLHISPNRKFKSDDESEYVSVSEAQQRVSNLTGELEKLTSQGDISGARKVFTKIANEKVRYVSTVSQYNETRAAYEGAVAKMNAELNSLKNFGKSEGDKK